MVIVHQHHHYHYHHYYCYYYYFWWMMIVETRHIPPDIHKSYRPRFPWHPPRPWEAIPFCIARHRPFPNQSPRHKIDIVTRDCRLCFVLFRGVVVFGYCQNDRAISKMETKSAVGRGRDSSVIPTTREPRNQMKRRISEKQRKKRGGGPSPDFLVSVSSSPAATTNRLCTV
jgi:hypothetical protein